MIADRYTLKVQIKVRIDVDIISLHSLSNSIRLRVTTIKYYLRFFLNGNNITVNENITLSKEGN